MSLPNGLKSSNSATDREAQLLFLLFLLAGLLFLWVPLLFAANCGGATPCNCGDTVTSDYTMTADLPCTTTDGLRMGSGTAEDPVVLDCAGFVISGNRTSQDVYGIYFRNNHHAEARNCKVTGWRSAGVRFRNSFSHKLRDSHVYDNGPPQVAPYAPPAVPQIHAGSYGIEFAAPVDASTCPSGGTDPCTYDIQVLNSTIERSADENIHFGGGSALRVGGDGTANYPPIILDGNTIKDAPEEQVYLLQSRYVTVRNSTITSTQGTAIYLKDADYNTIEGNAVERIVHVTGDSDHNLFRDNILQTNGYRFDRYTPDNTTPTANEVQGGSVNAPDGNCIRVEQCTGQTVRNLTFHACSDEVAADDLGDSNHPTQVTILSPLSFTGNNWDVLNGAVVDVGAQVGAFVTTSGEDPIEGATVTLTNVSAATLFALATDATGTIAGQDVLLYRRTASATVPYTPFTLTVEGAGFLTNVQTNLSPTADVTYTVELTYTTPPHFLIESPVVFAGGSTKKYPGDVTLRGGGQWRSSAAALDPQGFTVQVFGDLVLEAGAKRAIANMLGLGGSLTLTVTGDVVIRGDLDASAIATPQANGGHLVITADNITLDGASLKTDGGIGTGEAGDITLEAEEAVIVKNHARISAVAARGGAILLKGETLDITDSTVRAFGLTAAQYGTITGRYGTHYLSSNLTAVPTMEFVQ